MITLRPDQLSAVGAIMVVKRGIVKAPAGAGKTIIAAAAIRALYNEGLRPKVAWYAHTMEQCEQAREACAHFDLLGDGFKPAIVPHFFCYQSGHSAAPYDLVVLDECHHIAAEEFRKILDGQDGGRWGFSATPDREDDLHDDVFDLIGPIVHTVEREGLVESGKLLGAKVYFHAPNERDEFKNLIEDEAEKGLAKMKRFLVSSAAKIAKNQSIETVAKRLGVWIEVSVLAAKLKVDTDDSMSELPKTEQTRKWLMEAARIELLSRARWHACQTIGIFENEKRNGNIEGLAAHHVHQFQSVLVLVGSIEHGKHLAQFIPGSAVIYSKMGVKKRREAIADFRSGKLKCAIATSLADEGLDVPRANVLILAAAGRSEGKVEQRTGRVLRAFAEQTHGIIHDFWDWQQPLLLNQSRTRARVYAELKYEFAGGDAIQTALKTIGVKIHPLLKDIPGSSPGRVGDARKLGPTVNGREGLSPSVSTNLSGSNRTSPGQKDVSDYPVTHATSADVRPATKEVLQKLASTTDEAKARDTISVVGSERLTRTPTPISETFPATRSESSGAIAGVAPKSGVPNFSEKSSCGLMEPKVNSASLVTPLNTETEERKHAKLSPSTLKSKAICPGFINDPDGDKTAADRGTLGHKAVETNNPDLCGDDLQLRRAVEKCLKYRGKIVADALNGHRGPRNPYPVNAIDFFKEIRFEYFEQWGFCDEIVLGPGWAELLDWKFAYNFYEADGPQLWAYCLGAWNKWPELETITVHVAHPFLDEIDVETFTRAKHFADFQVKIKAVMAQANINDPTKYRISPQCAYCGFAGRCNKLAQLGFEIGSRYAEDLVIPDTDFHGSQVTDSKVMSALLRLAPIMAQAASGWKKASVEMYDNGTDIPGFKLVTKRGKRSVRSTVEVYEIVKTHFAKDMKPEEFLAHCSVTATGLDELVADTAPRGSKEKAKKELAARLEDADALTFGGGSRYLIPNKEQESDDE